MNTKQFFLTISLMTLALTPVNLFSMNEKQDNDNQGYFYKATYPIRATYGLGTWLIFGDKIENQLNEKIETLLNQYFDEKKNIEENNDFTKNIEEAIKLQNLKAGLNKNSTYHTYKRETAKSLGAGTGDLTFKVLTSGGSWVFEKFGYYTPQRKNEIEQLTDQKKQTNLAAASKYIEIAQQEKNPTKKQMFLRKAEEAINKNDILDEEFNKKTSKTNIDIWVERNNQLGTNLNILYSTGVTQEVGPLFFEKIKGQVHDLENLINEEKFEKYIKKEGLSYKEMIQKINASFDDLECSISFIRASDENGTLSLRTEMKKFIKAKKEEIAITLLKRALKEESPSYKKM